MESYQVRNQFFLHFASCWIFSYFNLTNIFAILIEMEKKIFNGLFKVFSSTSVNNPFEVIIILISLCISLSLLSSSHQSPPTSPVATTVTDAFTSSSSSSSSFPSFLSSSSSLRLAFFPNNFNKNVNKFYLSHILIHSLFD